MNENDIARFWSYVRKSGDGECWNWIGAPTFGYGYINIGGKKYRAHRVSWIIHYGEIPAGLLVCHHCDNRLCVNPKHLFLGDQKANINDALRKGRFHQGTKRKRAKLTEDDVKFILSSDKTANALASILPVTASHIHNIKRGKYYKHLNRCVITRSPAPRNRARGTILHLLHEAMRIVGQNTNIIPGHRRLGWTSGRWTNAVNILEHSGYARAVQGSGTYLTATYSCLADLCSAVESSQASLYIPHRGDM